MSELHTEHQGRVVNLNATATFNCAWCHKHPSIDAVDEHTIPVMRRGTTTRTAFVQPFNHFEHKLLIESHYPVLPGGFKCESCHMVPPTPLGKADSMSFHWSGCAGSGCHVAPQDSFMQLPASIRPAPETIAYTPNFLHMNTVFAHSAGHFATACETCHFAMRDQQNAQRRGFQEGRELLQVPCASTVGAGGRYAYGARHAQLADTGTAFAAVPIASGNTVTACGDCHLFHTHGPMLKDDFVGNPPRAFPTSSLLSNGRFSCRWWIARTASRFIR